MPKLLDLASFTNTFVAQLKEQHDNPRRFVIPLPEGAWTDAMRRFRTGEVTLLGGLPGHGKSAIAEQISFYVAKKFFDTAEELRAEGDEDFLTSKDADKPRGVLYCTLEMSGTQLVARALSQIASIPPTTMLEPEKLGSIDWRLIEDALSKISEWPVQIYDSSLLKSTDLDRIISEAQAHYQPRLVVIDYLQLMSDDTPFGGNETQKLDNLVKNLKEISRKHTCHVLALSSLNRGETDEFGIPTGNNLRGSGGIQYGADNLLIWHQPFLVNQHLDPAWKGVAVLKIEKQRSGESSGMFYMRFDPSRLRFENLTEEQKIALPPLKVRWGGK